MPTLLLSDIHLDASRPDISGHFLDYLEANAGRCSALYILGDLYETFVGDDDPDPHKREIEAALHRFGDAGARLYFQHGNRDFLVNDQFAARTGCTLLPETWITKLYGREVLMMHGDSLCTDDRAYQDFRRQVRGPEWQREFLTRPLEQRTQMARAARDASQTHMAGKPADIFDVNQDAVAAAMTDAGVEIMIHGHTHRPAIHRFDSGGVDMTRIVLGDWYDQGSVVVWDDQGFELETLTRSQSPA